MLNIEEINRRAKALIFGNMKIPNGISNPVLHEENGTFYIAYFGYTYGKQNVVEKKYNRPIRWILLNIENGDLEKVYDCTERDFSAEKKTKLYSLVDDNVKKPNKDYFLIMDSLFDTSRASVIYGKKLDKETYGAYLNNLYAITPKDYRIFYKELSI